MIFGGQSYNQILLVHFLSAELPQNLRSSLLIFLVIRSSNDMDNWEFIPSTVHYQNNMKIVKSTISDIVDNIKDRFESCPGFPQQFWLHFEHQDLVICLLIWMSCTTDRSFLKYIKCNCRWQSRWCKWNCSCCKWLWKRWHCVSSLRSSVLLLLIFDTFLKSWYINERRWYNMLAWIFQ